TIPPSVSITSPSSNSYINSKTITITGTSSDLNYNYTNISIWQGSTLINSTTTTNTSWSVQLGVQNDGIYNITATAYDKVGYNNSSSVQNIRIDTIPPSVSITSPSSNSYINSKTITITGTSSDLNYNYTNISIWQGSTLINSTITTSASWSVQLAAQDDGVYSISAVVYDLAGNENSSNVTDITVDTIIPQLTIISPLQSSPVYLRGSVPVQLKFNYNETNPANYTALLINSSGQIVSNISETLAISGDVNITASLSTTGLPNGNYSINVTIFDKVGQTITASEMNNVIIDNEIPGVIVNSPSSGQYIVGDTIVLNLTIFDDNLNYTQISIYNASESILNYTTNQSGTFTIDFTLPDDIYAINVTSFDLSGNNATATVTGVELDSTSPFYPNNCLDITLPGDYYLVNNIYSTNVTCIFIDADNVTVDGQGYEVRNLGNPIIPGIFAQDRANITIQNIIISHYDPDIQMINVTDAKIYNVTHNGGQIELIYTDAEIKNSRFENSSSKGMVANLSNIIINNTIIKNSQSDTLYMSSSNVSIFSSQIQNSNGVKGISISGQNNIITITSSDISLQTASNADVIDVDVSSTDNLYLSISDSNISNQNSFIHLRNSAGFESKNISINVFRNNIFNFSKIISSDSLVNGSGKILLTSDIHGNYWGRQSYPYVDLLDFQNVSDVSDEFPYKEVNGWNKEARFRLNSSSYNFASKDGKLSISMPYNPSSPNDNLVLSRLENEVFVITDLPLMHLAAENSIVNARLHYLFGTYESVYLPVEEREGLPLVTPLPIEIKVNLSDDFNTSEADNVSSVEFDENGFVKDLDGKFVFDSNEKSFKLKLSIINGSIDFLIGKKESDLILFDNVSPTVSLRQSGSIVIADYSDPLQQVTQRDDGRGNTYREVNSDQIIPLFLPNKAIVSNASIMLSPLSGTPSFNISIYLRNNITSLSSAERYYFNEISSLSSPIMLDLTSSMQSALGNCSQLHNGSYCLFYISINGLNDGEFNISEFNFNYSYSSGIKLPDVNTSGTITSLVEIPKHESDVFYLSDGGTDVLVISLPFKSYIKSAQITLSGEEWEGSYPSNVNMWIGNGSTLSGTPFVTYSGQFNTSIQVIAPFVYALRNYTSSADSDQKGNVLIPLTLNSSTKGKVRISSITIDYDLRNAYDLNSPSYIDGFNDGSEVKTVTFTNSSSSTILYIDVPKYSKVSNISIISSPSENITFNIDFLNDGVMEIENSTMIRQLNLTQYLENCSPYRFRIPYGRMCKVAINITANLDAYPSVDSDFEVTSEFISMPWAYAGSDSEIIRGSEKRFDFLTIPSGAVKRARSLSLEHHSIYSLQSGDIVIGYGLDMAGNRGSGNYTFIVAGPPTSPPVTPPLTKIPLSGWMNCTNSLAYVITEPGASVTVLFKSSGMFVTGGTADSNGRFEFTPLLSGDYSIRASKSGFEDNQITLTANICIVETQISAKKSLICSQDKCNINLYFATNKISDLQFRLTDFVPSSLIKTIDSIVDRFGKTFYSYSYTDSLISIPSTQKITSTFSVILDTVLTAIPNYIENENKFIYSITNTAADVELDEIIIPLPENAKGKEIASIEYIDADGSKINIMDYTVESDRIIIHQPVIIKKQ
ncbi:MAG: Ig-like domain-containing protein, partial [Candidatus Micrarchaeia archaeon]